MKIWRTLSLLGLLITAFAVPASAQESLMQQQDMGVNVTETAVPPALDGTSAMTAQPVKKHHAVAAHKKAKKHAVHKTKAQKHKAKKHKAKKHKRHSL